MSTNGEFRERLLDHPGGSRQSWTEGDATAPDSEEAGSISDGPDKAKDKAPRRDLIAFWLLGLTNNFAYVIMLSAAHDILSQHDPGLGTGIILLADVRGAV